MLLRSALRNAPCWLLTALVGLPVLVLAHHSSALFDASRSLTLNGVVQEFRWTNPHASLQVLAKDVAGREQEQWTVEMSSPEYLARAGWQPDTLRPGDAVILVVYPMRDGTKHGQYVAGTGPRGPLKFSSPAAAPAETLSPALADPACAPRMDVTLVEPSESPETRPVKLEELTVFVRRNAIVTTSDISEIGVAGDDFDTLIQIKYAPTAAARLHDATTGHDGLKLAFVVDDDVWLYYTWKGPYGIEPDGTQISIRHGWAKAQRLMESIRGCIGAQAR